MPKSIKLYTKTGDDGTSQLATGQRLPKSHPIFQVLGDLDELNSFLGWSALVLDYQTVKDIHQIQHKLLDLGSLIAGSTKPSLTAKHLAFLESKIDSYQAEFGPNWYTTFILPGASEPAARIDITRAVCRRTERTLQHLSQTPDFKTLTIKHFPQIRQYINRLSDYLFGLRCFINFSHRATETIHR